jgi:hypothetical protein
MSNASENKVSETNVRIQYINNDQPSSLTIKSSLFKLLTQKFETPKQAQKFCKEQALKAINDGTARGRISDRVFEAALKEVIDPDLRQHL